MNKLITVSDAELIIKALKIQKVLTDSTLIYFTCDIPLTLEAAMYLDEKKIHVNDLRDDDKTEIWL